ncbi:MAG: peptidoglycan editing factor PgeF [Pseudomonadota bacterium]
MRSDLPVMLPDWPTPPGVHAVVSTRAGGVSRPPYDSLNLATHVGDDPQAVAENRRRLREGLGLPAEPLWLEQVHGTDVCDASLQIPAFRTLLNDSAVPAWGRMPQRQQRRQSLIGGGRREFTSRRAELKKSKEGLFQHLPKADAAYTDRPGVVLAVLTADCLPVLFASRDGREIGVAHAGWRGLEAGVLEATLGRFTAPPAEIIAWLGPAIGPAAFEVGDEVRAAFVARHAEAAEAFAPTRTGHWLADLYRLARQRLAARGVGEVYGGPRCTFSDAARFYSYRRDGVTGRMATLIWRAS